MENVALWHERDISHSSVERVIIPDSCIVLDYMMDLTIKLISNLLVYPEKMINNLNLTRGLIYSQTVLLHLLIKVFQEKKPIKLYKGMQWMFGQIQIKI
jgi:adenylosuccinate lyase